MALSKSVASELLEAFRAGEGVDLIRESVRSCGVRGTVHNPRCVELGQEVRSAATASDELSARATRCPTFLIVVNLAPGEFLDGMVAKIG